MKIPEPRMMPRMIAQPSIRPSSFFILLRSLSGKSVGGTDPLGDCISSMTVSVGELSSKTPGMMMTEIGKSQRADWEAVRLTSQLRRC